jgi:hypothetical protein
LADWSDAVLQLVRGEPFLSLQWLGTLALSTTKCSSRSSSRGSRNSAVFSTRAIDGLVLPMVDSRAPAVLVACLPLVDHELVRCCAARLHGRVLWHDGSDWGRCPWRRWPLVWELAVWLALQRRRRILIPLVALDAVCGTEGRGYLWAGKIVFGSWGGDLQIVNFDPLGGCGRRGELRRGGRGQRGGREAQVGGEIGTCLSDLRG